MWGGAQRAGQAEAHLGIRSLDGLDGAEVLLQASDQLLLLNSLGCGLSEVDLQLCAAPCGERKMQQPSEESQVPCRQTHI